MIQASYTDLRGMSRSQYSGVFPETTREATARQEMVPSLASRKAPQGGFESASNE